LKSEEDKDPKLAVKLVVNIYLTNPGKLRSYPEWFRSHSTFKSSQTILSQDSIGVPTLLRLPMVL
jgi:hypothetical protein